MTCRRLTLVVSAVALLLPAPAGAYPWPLIPMNEQHPIRGNFDDPRITQWGVTSFHFGVDISAENGTPVFAVKAGVADRQVTSVSIASGKGVRIGYWHILPEVRSGQRIHVGQRIGVVAAPFGHVHFAESIRGVYVDPLRPDGLEPYVDQTVPTITSINVANTAIPGELDLTVDAYDTPPIAPPPPWDTTHVTPCLIRWQVLNGDQVVLPWRMAVDFKALIPVTRFWLVYVPGTTANRPGRPGTFRYYVARHWDSHVLPNGTYRLQVEVLDERQNRAEAEIPLVIAN